MPSRLQQTIQEYRARLLNQERTAMASLDYAHRQTLALIEPQLDALYAKMQKALDKGENISTSWLYEQNRLQTLTNYIANAIDHYGALTQMQVERLQYNGVRLGQQSGMALLNSVVPPGVNFSFGVPSQQAIANLVGATQKGSPLADLFNGFGAEAAQGAKTALISGVTLGYNPRQIAPAIQDALNVSRNRALTIARDQLNDTYRSANMETFRANDDVVDGWIWQCDLTPRTCAACIAMSGTEHDLSEDMEEHVCGRCVAVPKTKSWDSILGPLGIDTSGLEDTTPQIPDGQEWFSNQSAETQQAILGKAKYQLYADNKITLQDMVGKTHSKDWGTSVHVKPVKDLVKR